MTPEMYSSFLSVTLCGSLCRLTPTISHAQIRYSFCYLYIVFQDTGYLDNVSDLIFVILLVDTSANLDVINSLMFQYPEIVLIVLCILKMKWLSFKPHFIQKPKVPQ